MENKGNTPNSLLREQLNVIIALLLIIIGEEGQKELLKKRRANRDLIKYLHTQFKFNNKDLSGIFNSAENSIANMKAGKKNKKK